jgi:hypothetical protein
MIWGRNREEATWLSRMPAAVPTRVGSDGLVPVVVGDCTFRIAETGPVAETTAEPAKPAGRLGMFGLYQVLCCSGLKAMLVSAAEETSLPFGLKKWISAVTEELERFKTVMPDTSCGDGAASGAASTRVALDELPPTRLAARTPAKMDA